MIILRKHIEFYRLKLEIHDLSKFSRYKIRYDEPIIQLKLDLFFEAESGLHEVKSQIALGLSVNFLPSSEARMIIVCKHTGFYRLKLEVYDASKFSIIQYKVCGAYFVADIWFFCG